MIGISYQQSTPQYDAYLKRIASKTLEDLQNFVKRTPLANLGVISGFINMFLSGAQFETFMNTPVQNLSALIDMVENNFPQLRSCRLNANLRNSDSLYLFLKYHLVKHGYERGFQEKGISYSLPKDELIKSIDANVCPYCNRAFIYSTRTSQGNKIIQAEMDHFYSKELFPYLAIAKYNLVPSCSCCNGRGGKFTADAFAKHLINPYLIINASNYLEFRLRVKNANVTSLDKLANGLSMRLIAKQPHMQNNIDTFNLKGLYQHHTEYAAELYFKWLVKATHIYRTSLKDILRKKGITLTDEDVKRIIVGNYVRETDFCKRPLAKMMHDIAKELGLI